MQAQTALGSEKLYTKPVYDQVQIGRVTSVANYDKWGKVEVIFLDYSQPFPVWVNGDLDRKPVEGDQVLVGFIQGRPDAPYLAGFVRNQSYTANFIKVEKDRVILQVPTNSDDVKGHMTDESKKASRAYIELKGSEVIIHAPKVTIADGTHNVAREGDSVKVNVPAVGNCDGSGTITGTVSVNVPGVGTCTGSITSGTASVTTYVKAVGDCTGSITSGNSKIKG